MRRNFKCEVAGLAAGGQTWKFNCELDALPGDFALLASEVIRRGFLALTSGNAVYGNPGVGCQGPYSITKLLIEEVPNGEAKR